jgi:putative addiction module component (TIGR02574 family)
MATLDEIRSTILQLPQDDRAELARDLLVSLDGDTTETSNVEQVWNNEILARSEAYSRGEVTARDWHASVERVRQALDGQGPTS